MSISYFKNKYVTSRACSSYHSTNPGTAVHVSRFSANPGYFQLCFNAAQTSEICSIVSLRLCVDLLQQRESNRTTTFRRKSNTPRIGRRYYRGAVYPYAYHPKASVAQRGNNSPPAFSQYERGATKSLNQIE